ncbi:aminoglycoside phosphotransferase family protein [uncultured Reyranella sp.]|uniref:phosphotransferase n=1 Tax=uncultured Reyranella sp. TaxID=735512 RepID=UPI0025DF8E55|nr:aminoglycoside phosphotransferase family protein [uncultured Reyranella sp.]
MADMLDEIREGEALPATGTAHGHVRLKDGRLARIAYAYEDDPTAGARLHQQAEAFRHLAPAGRTPRLHEVIEPRPGLPGGALIVDFIEGRAPRLPDELDAMADTLARLHSLPLPGAGARIPHQNNPFRTTLDVVEEGVRRFLDKAVADPGARAEIVEELELMRTMAKTLVDRPQPLSIALADTHPGNFIVDRAGIAWFVDLEKVHVGSPAIDLAHATLPTSTVWHPDVGKVLSLAEVEGFYESYLKRIGKIRAAELQPWLQPMRRLTWLRTTMFMARWKVQTEAPRDPSDPSQWSDAGLSPAMRDHLRSRIALSFKRETIRAIRAEWL